jgi:hypothetical protein
VQILIKRKVDGPSVPELGTPTSVTFDSITVPLNRASTGPAALAQYELQRSLDGSTWSTIATGPSIFGNPPVQFVDGGRIALTTYYYRARALDVAGRASGYSATVSATTAATIAPSTALVYPRVATYWIGSPHNYENPAYQAGAARFDLVIWNNWETWGQGRAMSYAQACANVKALNPAVKLFQYSNHYDVIAAPGGTGFVLENTLDAQNWWLRASWPNGEKIIEGFYPGWLANALLNRPNKLNGQDYIEWLMSTYTRDMFVNGVYSNLYGRPQANPHIDGIFYDNIFIKPRHSGDWYTNGSSVNQSDVALGTAFREAIRAGYQAHRAMLPAFSTFGNNSESTLGYNPHNLPTPIPEYVGVMDFGLVENHTGASYSTDEWGSTAQLLSAIKIHAANLTDPSGQFCVGTRRHTLTSRNYQDFRYSFSVALCGSDGYVGYSDHTVDSWGSSDGYNRTAQFFDEYDNAGTQRYYLGVAENAVVTAAWQSGVYLRRFQNGWVLLNPKGNGTRTVNLGQTMRKLQGRSGFSDTTVNNGAQVTSVTLQDRDGLVLLKV